MEKKDFRTTEIHYFGDWVGYNGHNDVGYYPGCQFVRDILSRHELDDMICFDIDIVDRLFKRFIMKE